MARKLRSSRLPDATADVISTEVTAHALRPAGVPAGGVSAGGLATHEPGAGPGDRRWLILAVIGVAQLMVVLDATIVNIALPSAQRRWVSRWPTASG